MDVSDSCLNCIHKLYKAMTAAFLMGDALCVCDMIVLLGRTPLLALEGMIMKPFPLAADTCLFKQR